MKTKILILTIGLLFAFTTNAQRKLSRDEVQITKTKNAKVLGTTVNGDVFDNSGVLDTLASKSDVKNYTAGQGINLTSDVISLDINHIYKTKGLFDSSAANLVASGQDNDKYSYQYNFSIEKAYKLSDLTFEIELSEASTIYLPNSDFEFTAPITLSEGVSDITEYVQKMWFDTAQKTPNDVFDYYLLSWYYIKADTNVISNFNVLVKNSLEEVIKKESSGLEKISVAGGDSWALKNREINNYGTLKGSSVDLSIAKTQGQFGSTGEFSFCSGVNNKAMGSYSTVVGGVGLVSKSKGEVVVGMYNTDYTPNYSNEDRLFVIGNGTGDLLGGSRSDALIIKKNGKILAPSLDLFKIDSERSLTTQEYVLSPKDLLKLNPKALPILTATDRSIALDSSDNKLKFWDGTSWHSLY